jgi:signal transduction histidine kinase/FixJ family two-component response regulator
VTRTGDDALPGDLAVAVALGGETGRLFAEYDWAAHPLGPPAEWPVEIRAIVATALTSRFPIVLWLGPEDLFLVYNDAYLPILGYKHPASLGQRGRDVWWDIWETIHPMLASVIATGEATWADDLLLPVVTAGRARERYFTFTYSPLVGNSGKVYGIFSAVTETTQRVLSERRMHVLNSVASAVMDTRTIDDALSAAVTACAAQPTDLPFVAAYVGGEGTDDLTLRAATPPVLPLLPRTLAELTDWNPDSGSRPAVRIIDGIASMIHGLDEALGSACPAQALVFPIGEGSTAGALVVGANAHRPLDMQYRSFCQLLAAELSSAMASAVSFEQERQRADVLAELDRAKTAFLTNVSHEFRTPLTLLTGPLDDALSDAGSDAVLANRLRTARSNAGRLLRLVDSLLDFSRIEAGRAAADLVCTDVGALTSSITSSFTELCARAGLELAVDCDPVLADIDPGMWETILLNLLSNAVKYTLAGMISVEVHGESAQCRTTVRDTGIGIAEADLNRIGERFYRAANASGRSVGGTGIGLSLVRGLVELQHGNLYIDSEVDRGTTVTISLPTSADHTPVDHSPVELSDNPYVVEASQWLATDPVSRTDVAAHDDRRELVLVADDNADMRDYLQQVLSSHWRTVLVADGESALSTARELHPDAIVTDIMMPRLDGFHFVAALRADPDLAATPVLMLSARAGAEAASEGFAGGADDYLPKPFRSQDLIDRVAARLAAADREREGRQQHQDELQLAADLAELDAALQAADSIPGILAALLDSSLASGDAAGAVIGVLEVEENKVRFEFDGSVPAEFRDRYHVAELDAPMVAVDVVKTGEPMITTDTLELPARYQQAVQDTADTVRAMVMHPLRGAAGHVIGVVGLVWPTPRKFGAEELELFSRTAEVTASAVERCRNVEREHRVAVEFQEQLLDVDRGSTAAAVAALYQPAGEAMRVGGDWYLVTPLDPPGRIGISVGDVVGHGLPAAVVMSRLRAATAAAALTEADPATIMSVLDRYAATVPGARGATVSYAVVDTDAATINYSCAGHPYPLLLAPEAQPRFLESGRRPPVAIGGDGSAGTVASGELPPGAVVVLYTDGLIEGPGRTLDDGFARLLDTAACCAELPVGDICAELLDRMAPPGGYTDDVVVLALRPSHAAARSFATVLPAALDELHNQRCRLSDWLTAVGVGAGRAADIVLAANETVTNAITHGSGCDPRRTVSVEAFLRGDTCAVTVSDSGSWSADSSASRLSDRGGRGLTVINALADHVDTVRTSRGTRVTLGFDHAVRAQVLT